MFEDNLETLLSFVSTPLFSPESVKKEQGIIGQEILMSEDDPDYCLYYNLMKALYRHSPLRDSVAGTIESISAITAQTLYDCHRAFYNPSNMVLCVAGDVDASDVYDVARNILPSSPGEVPERDYGPRDDQESDQPYVSCSMEVSQPIFLAGCKSEPAGRGRDTLHLELVSAIALDVLAGHSSPLYIRLYGEGLVSSDFSASFDFAAGAAPYYIRGRDARPGTRIP
jgi:predicted Zn-dependent peptidase